MRESFGSVLGVTLVERPVKVADDASMKVDGVSSQGPIFCEMFAHIGSLKAGQRHKLKGDVLKLTTLRAVKGPEAKLFIVVADRFAEEYLTRGWVGEAVRAADITVRIVLLPPELQDEVHRAQARQYR